MLGRPTRTDPEIAAARLKTDIEQLWSADRPRKKRWGLIWLDDLHVVAALPAVMDARADYFFVKLGAEYYDAFPPTTAFVDPNNWEEPTEASPWLPRIENAPNFGLHLRYGFPDGTHRQLVCFTMTAEYYMVGHSPPETTVWRQGRHTVSATISRLSELLSPPYYRGPTRDRNP